MKQVIVVNASLKMPPGKMAAQVAHASVAATLQVGQNVRNYWMVTGMTKIVLRGEDENALKVLRTRAIEEGLPQFLVVDEGRTCVPPDSTTCLAIGPAPDEDIDELTGDLKLIR